MEPIKHSDSASEQLIATKLVDEIYGRLRSYAALCVRSGQGSQTPTSIVHDAIVRLGDERRFEGPEHLFASAAVAIRHTLVDRARRRKARKRVVGWDGSHAEQVVCEGTGVDAAILELDEALARLAEVDPRAARVVELRFFGGLTAEDVAELLGVSRKTACEDWAFARAWLSHRLGSSAEGSR